MVYMSLQRSDEEKFALQLQQLAVLGFSNHTANLEGKLVLCYS